MSRVSVRAPSHADTRPPYRHEALLFSGADQFLERALPFVADAVESDEPVMIALVDDHWAPLRATLGPLADRVDRVDMSRLGRNPARIIPAWNQFVDRHRGTGRTLRGIGEPIWPGRRPAELDESQLHEALLNVALPAQTPLWLLCPYDTAALGDDVLEEARRSHPTLTDLAHSEPSDGFGGTDHAVRLWERALPAPTVAPESYAFARGDLAALRGVVRSRATAATVATARAEDLTLAVNELAANSLDHGGGEGVLRIWSEAGAFVCEVQDSGRIADLLVGRRTPVANQPRGRGLWMVNQLCDLVQIRSTTAGTVVRVHSWV
jgi:anti-sigma regulatory factor (Ser/Thr protein kinase)